MATTTFRHSRTCSVLHMMCLILNRTPSYSIIQLSAPHAGQSQTRAHVQKPNYPQTRHDTYWPPRWHFRMSVANSIPCTAANNNLIHMVPAGSCRIKWPHHTVSYPVVSTHSLTNTLVCLHQQQRLPSKTCFTLPFAPTQTYQACPSIQTLFSASNDL